MKLAKNDRGLKPNEKATAFSVFLDTIPYQFIRISDGLGGGNRPFTYPGAPLSIGGIAGKVFGGMSFDFIIYINFGSAGYADALYDAKTFIHEMTHAWQYLHGVHVAADSISNQIAYGDGAYDYDKPAGLDWDLYNVEQQAEIVADWYEFANAPGASPTGNAQHPNYKYIRDHIRANKPR